jgi:PERQ amino acid-rich with GYF domain-containing protein
MSTQQQPYASSTTSQSPWGTPDLSGLKRPGPFDTPHPTVRNTTVKQASSWERNSRAPWNAVSQIELLPESRIDPEHSLTVSNLEQHNQQHLLQEAIISSEHMVLPASESIPPSNRPPREAIGKVISGVPNLATISSPDVPIIETQAPKGRRKAPLQVKLSLQEPAKPPSPTLPSSVPQVKAAWSKEDEAKASNLALGFREIQEAEAKKAEARKIIERERERAARAVSVLPNPNEESATFTASWGLPTSQVHSNRNSISKEATSGTSPNTVPVWTSVSKPVVTKKTMKEIQEEEEKRKKIEATKEKETIGAAVRRAYAESTNKVCSLIYPQKNTITEARFLVCNSTDWVCLDNRWVEW